MEAKLSWRFGLGDPRQTDLAASTQIEPDFNHRDLLEKCAGLERVLNYRQGIEVFVSGRLRSQRQTNSVSFRVTSLR
ncbi:MAG: hypothetical protein QOE55_1469 [Acidobacteriaceae bacterium]|jgi:hypothetical protein|nr:hypothetical protein [Acidobacteriaceae bacterium]